MRKLEKAEAIAVKVTILCLIILAWRNDKKTDEINTVISILAIIAIVTMFWMKLQSDRNKNKEKKQEEKLVQNK